MVIMKDLAFTPNVTPNPAPTAGGKTSPKHSPPLDVRSTVSDPVPINTPIEPTEVFKNTVNDIIEAIPYLADSMFYRTKALLLLMVELHQELKVAASNYQAVVPNPRKYPLHAVTALIKPSRGTFRTTYTLPTPLIHLDTKKCATMADANHIDSINELLLSTGYITVTNIFASKSTGTISTIPTTYPSHIISPLSSPSTPPSGFPPESPLDFPFETPLGAHT